MIVPMMDVREVWMFMCKCFVAMPMLMWLSRIPGGIVLVLMVHVMHVSM